MVKRIAAAMVGIFLAGALVAAPAARSTARSSFARPSAAAVSALNKTVGKPFTGGYVFIDGRYIKPPYTVERCGTVLRVNGLQISGEIVPWEDFIKTQSGVTMTKTEVPVVEEAAAEPEPEVEEEEEEEDDAASSLDDLFDDDPKPKKPAAKKTVKRKASKPKPKKPTAVVSYSFDGNFTPNERSKALVAKINSARTKIDSQLRAGGIFFFSGRYAPISGDAGAARRIVEKLPDIMKKSAGREAFGSACRQVGMGYFPAALLDDLHRNRFDYLQLVERRKADQSRSQWQNLLGE